MDAAATHSYLDAYAFTVEFGDRHYGVGAVVECQRLDKHEFLLRVVYGLTERDEGQPNLLLDAHEMQKQLLESEEPPEIHIHHKTREGDVALTRTYKVTAVLLGFGPLQVNEDGKALAKVDFHFDPSHSKVRFHDLAIPRKEREIAQRRAKDEEGAVLAEEGREQIRQTEDRLGRLSVGRADNMTQIDVLETELKALKHKAESE